MKDMESRALNVVWWAWDVDGFTITIVFQFYPIEIILNVIKFIDWGVEFENIELKSITSDMRRDKFLTDWDNE